MGGGEAIVLMRQMLRAGRKFTNYNVRE